MKDMMSYKGYYGSVHYSDEDRVFHGKIEFIRSLVSYETFEKYSISFEFKEGENFNRRNTLSILRIEI